MTSIDLDSIPPERWAYLAGLFVGEGCFDVCARRGLPCFELKIAMQDRGAIEGVVASLGGVVRAAGNAGRGRRLADAYAWREFDGARSIEVVRRLLPYMEGNKRAQGEAFLLFALRKMELYERRTQEKRAKYTDAERLELFQLALVAREFAGGGSKGWRRKWDTTIQQLSQGVEA